MIDVGISDLFEDGIGFGAKTLRTLRDAIGFPRRYFLAAQTKDWSGYTPSIRVYVVLLAISSYLRYLYIGEGQLMTELYAGQFEQVINTLETDEPRWSQVDSRALTDAVLDRLFFYTPFLSFALYTLFGIAWRAYAEPLNLAVRVRYIYALLVPATVFMLICTIAMVSLPQSFAPSISLFSMFGTAIIMAVTAYFGAFPETESAGGRFGRAFTLGFALTGVMLVAVVGSLMIAIFVSMGEAYAATAVSEAAGLIP